MRFPARASTLHLALAAMVVGFGCARKSSPSGKPSTALVIAYDQGKVAKIRRLTDEKKVAALAAFFPGYEKRPSSSVAAGWKRGYDVYFDFAEGFSVRLSVSSTKNNPAHWSAGRGDFDLDDDFHAHVAGLTE
jgi:hypothetical protein